MKRPSLPNSGNTTHFATDAKRQSVNGSMTNNDGMRQKHVSLINGGKKERSVPSAKEKPQEHQYSKTEPKQTSHHKALGQRTQSHSMIDLEKSLPHLSLAKPQASFRKQTTQDMFCIRNKNDLQHFKASPRFYPSAPKMKDDFTRSVLLWSMKRAYEIVRGRDHKIEKDFQHAWANELRALGHAVQLEQQISLKRFPEEYQYTCQTLFDAHHRNVAFDRQAPDSKQLLEQKRRLDMVFQPSGYSAQLIECKAVKKLKSEHFEQVFGYSAMTGNRSCYLANFGPVSAQLLESSNDSNSFFLIQDVGERNPGVAATDDALFKYVQKETHTVDLSSFIRRLISAESIAPATGRTQQTGSKNTQLIKSHSLRQDLFLPRKNGVAQRVTTPHQSGAQLTMRSGKDTKGPLGFSRRLNV
ncbi:PD-D/EXK nuclease superfamily protein [Nitzschia inconspicua]|uniref:PD-D/EXK nuclease superfamily protein n=1 Tax=Nitzschia inconspicua TaxID=303405 RepID=A0A9K3PEC9_9STRA|nr:PD-D/EXK nuclease superfamily protein [Nitzschia inconspicua]